MASRIDIIDRHQQLYDWSCPASAVELVLKLHGRVGGGYRKLQDNHNAKTAGFGPFRNRVIRGLFFYERSWEYPFPGLATELANEISAGRFPILGLLSGVRTTPSGNVGIIHEWLIFRKIGNDFEAVSKSLRVTTKKSVVAGLKNLPQANVLLYRM